MLKRAKKPASDASPAPLAPLNAGLEAGGDLPDTVWTEWLWRTDPEEPLAASILLNRCHLLGLLLCRHQAATQARAAEAGAVDDDRMTLMAKHPHDMTLRELRDTVDNILIEWPRFLDRLDDNPNGQENLKAVGATIDACFARVGQLAAHTGGPDVFDDGNMTEPDDADSTRMRLTRPCLRRLLGTFLVLYRHLHLLAMSEPIEPEPHDCKLCRHHMEASTDDFNLLCMFMTLPVAACLNYKQDFPGMYNHVSQVVYFHNAQYERRARIPLAEAGGGDPMQVLPAIRQLYPEVGMHYEEDHVDLSRPTGRWFWMVLPGRIYLVGPDQRVYHSSNVTSLLRVYLELRD